MKIGFANTVPSGLELNQQSSAYMTSALGHVCAPFPLLRMKQVKVKIARLTNASKKYIFVIASFGKAELICKF